PRLRHLPCAQPTYFILLLQSISLPQCHLPLTSRLDHVAHFTINLNSTWVVRVPCGNNAPNQTNHTRSQSRLPASPFDNTPRWADDPESQTISSSVVLVNSIDSFLNSELNSAIDFLFCHNQSKRPLTSCTTLLGRNSALNAVLNCSQVTI